MSWFPTPHVDGGEVVKPGSKRFIPFEAYAQPTLLDAVKDADLHVNHEASTLADAFIKKELSGTLPDLPDPNPLAS